LVLRSMLAPSSFRGSGIGSSALTFTGNGVLVASDLVEVFNTSTFSGVLSGPGGLTVAGPGNLILSGSNTYSGGTVLNSAGGGLTANFYNGTAPSFVTGANFNQTPTTARLDGTIAFSDNTTGILSGP